MECKNVCVSRSNFAGSLKVVRPHGGRFAMREVIRRFFVLKDSSMDAKRMLSQAQHKNVLSVMEIKA
ncbi:hypothetical protein [Xanthomonas campestris]|uniref:hypothetical protein n=1 Tax=Xanthomonas campestris TaxID=339 RepID=UPI0011AF27F3|nr:hypothetical protein [Xanthomonas campestris]